MTLHLNHKHLIYFPKTVFFSNVTPSKTLHQVKLVLSNETKTSLY